MFYKAAEHKVIIKDTAMDYVEFGYGSRPLIILPGLGDGLRTVHGQAVNLAFYYRKIASYYRVYIFSRKNKLEEGEKIVQIMQITVYVNSEPDFTKQPKIADFASEYFCEELGESGVGSRAAVGVAVLPGEAPVEIAIIAGVGSIKY